MGTKKGAGQTAPTMEKPKPTEQAKNASCCSTLVRKNALTKSLRICRKKEQNPALLILEGLSPSRKDSSWVTSVLRK